MDIIQKVFPSFRKQISSLPWCQKRPSSLKLRWAQAGSFKSLQLWGAISARRSNISMRFECISRASGGFHKIKDQIIKIILWTYLQSVLLWIIHSMKHLELWVLVFWWTHHLHFPLQNRPSNNSCPKPKPRSLQIQLNDQAPQAQMWCSRIVKEWRLLPSVTG